MPKLTDWTLIQSSVWVVNYPTQACPMSWDDFECIFQKEFLSRNSKNCNWTAWDLFRMEGLTLTQYVSKYCKVILKLDGLDDF